MNAIEVGTLVRVKSGCRSVDPGEVFRVSAIHKSANAHAWNGLRHVPDPEKPDWFAMGDKNGRGVWAQFLEPIEETFESAVDQLCFDAHVFITPEEEPSIREARVRLKAGLAFAYANGWEGF